MDLLDRLLGHDRWTTHRILAICATLTEEQLAQDWGIGHGSLDETLRHMIGNVQVWTDLMRSRPVASGEALKRADVAELAGLFEAAYGEFAETARAVRDDGRWDEVYLDVLDEPPQPKSFGGTIAHVITHNMHHRAELLHMLGRLGVAELPEGDVLGWEASARG
jgi:uncharacterized damage-inducible protein DinB